MWGGVSPSGGIVLPPGGGLPGQQVCGEQVCGVDGQTYLNKCEADKANVEILHEDHCGCLPNTAKECREFFIGIIPGVRTSPPLRPVCGVDGNTYLLTSGNFASDNNIIREPNSVNRCCIGNIQCRGECPCPCPDVFSPVCGGNGLTYQNSCYARAAGVQSLCHGECPCHLHVHICYKLCFGICFYIC